MQTCKIKLKRLFRILNLKKKININVNIINMNPDASFSKNLVEKSSSMFSRDAEQLLTSFRVASFRFYTRFTGIVVEMGIMHVLTSLYL